MTRLTILYTKKTQRGMELMAGFGAEPSLLDLRNDYEVVFEGAFAHKPDSLRLDAVFTRFNNDRAEINPLASPEGQNKILSLNVSHTSMSVGDIIMIDHEAYLCSSVGWKSLEWLQR